MDVVSSVPVRPSGRSRRLMKLLARLGGLITFALGSAAFAGEADLKLPDLSQQTYFGHSIDGHALLMWGFLACFLGLGFGLVQFMGLRKLPVHKAMREISELIYSTCKTYLFTQGKFLIVLEILVAIVIYICFGVLQHMALGEVGIILLFSVLGILGSYGVAWFGIRVNTYANSRTAFASLRGKPFPTYDIPLRAGMSIGMVLISIELLMMFVILLFIPGKYSGLCFIGFAIGESLGATVLRIAGGIFTKIADIGSDLMKIVFGIKEDDARNPGVIADCTGDNAGDSVGPSADGFETYGVTGVALITFIILAGASPAIIVDLLVWVFVIRVVMLFASFISYLINSAIQKARFANADKMNFENPLSWLVWITSIISIAFTFIISYLTIADLGDGTMWWKLSVIVSCGTLAGAIIPEMVKVFTSTESAHVDEVVTSSREGGASLNIISGLVAGNFSAFWLGLVMVALMVIGYWVSLHGMHELFGGTLDPSPVFAFGLVAFGFLGMGPVTIAVDSYGPVTDNAQSVYELSLIEEVPNISEEVQKEYGFKPEFEKGKEFLEENDGAGNTFKATAKPVLIGTAVVGATTMIFAIIEMLTNGLTTNLDKLSLMHAPFLLGLATGGAVIFWFSGASMQAVSTGAYRAVEFIKKNIKLDGATKASTEDSNAVVKICTTSAQSGMINIFLVIFFFALAFACIDPFFFIGYLISIALFGLYQSIFMANAGGAWDNAKKLVETTLRAKNTPLHEASIVGDTVGDPFKDTSSVAMNPVIKFTTLFGVLAVELAVSLSDKVTNILAVIFFLIAIFFVWRSFYGMRIQTSGAAEQVPAKAETEPAA